LLRSIVRIARVRPSYLHRPPYPSTSSDLLHQVSISYSDLLCELLVWRPSYLQSTS
ncbi:hypothetical protein KI387_030287, partial [Taxus chinensis]